MEKTLRYLDWRKSKRSELEDPELGPGSQALVRIP